MAFRMSRVIRFRVGVEDAALIERAAAAKRLSVSDWLRRLAVTQAKFEIAG